MSKDRGVKEGVHGFKAFLIVVGSGVLAALLVVGLIVALVKTVGAALSGGSSSSVANQEGIPPGTWEPAPSMEEGALNLCRSLETSGQAGAFREMGPVRVDSGGNYSDPGPGVEDRSVQDDCTWEVYGPGGEKWTFSLSYEALAGSGSDEQRIAEATDLFSQEESSVRGVFDSLFSEESMVDMADESISFYGVAGGGEKSLYIFLGRTRSGVFRIDVEIPFYSSEPIDENEPRTLVRKVVPVIDMRLERVLPA